MRTIITIILLTFTTMVYSQETTVTQHIDDAVTACEIGDMVINTANVIDLSVFGILCLETDE